MVGSSAGYAILVEGKISTDEGLGSHNKTANRIYETLKDRGLRGRQYLSTSTTPTMIPGVDAAQTDQDIGHPVGHRDVGQGAG